MDLRSILAKRENRRTGQGLAVFGLALERLQKFALDNKLLDKPVFGKLEKPRVGQRDRVPTQAETEAILARGSPEFRLIYLTLRQYGARPNELCRARIADVDRPACVITLKEHKT